MTKLYAQEKRVFDINKVTVVGSPTITSDGVASGFSQNNGIKAVYPLSTTQDFAIEINFNKLEDVAVNTGICFFNSIYAYIQTNNSIQVFRDNTYSPAIKLNSLEFKLRIENDKVNSRFLFKIYEKDILIGEIPFTAGYENVSNIFLGGGFYTASQYGSIDLSQFSITVDGELVYSPIKPVYALERRKEGFDLSKFTVVGSPTITSDGVASGFTTNNYVTFNSVIDTNKTFNFKGSFVYKKATASQNILHSFATTGGQLAGGCRILLGSTGNLTLWAYTGTVDGRVVLSADNFTDGDNIDFEFSFSNNKRELKVSKDGGLTWITGENNTLLNFTGEWQGFTLGFDGYAGSINLPSISITADGKEVFTGAKEKFYAMRGM